MLSMVWKLWKKPINSSLMENKKHSSPLLMVPKDMIFKVDSRTGEFLP